MTKNKIIKIIVAILISITLFTILTQTGFCKIDITKFDGKTDKSEATNKIAGILGSTLNLVQVIGLGVAIIMLVVIGIRWVGAPANKRVEIKKTLVLYVMGAIFIFAAVGLLQIIKMFTGGAVGAI